MVKIVPYESRHHSIFRSLNLTWLDQYHLTESHDLEVLDNPRATIIDRGGVILLAEYEGQIVGSVALMPEGPGIYELAKMAVAPHMQGKGIGKQLITAILDSAKQKGATKLILFSNHQLQTAIAMYEKFGFRHVAVTDSPFVTADVKMEFVFVPDGD